MAGISSRHGLETKHVRSVAYDAPPSTSRGGRLGVRRQLSPGALRARNSNNNKGAFSIWTKFLFCLTVFGIIFLIVLIDEGLSKKATSFLYSISGPDLKSLKNELPTEFSKEGFCPWTSTMQSSASVSNFLSKTWASSLEDGSTVSFYSNHGTFLSPGNTSEQGVHDWSDVKCSKRGQIDASMAFKVVQVSPTSFRFVAPNGKYLAAKGQESVGASEDVPTDETVFRIVWQKEGFPKSVFLQASDGHYLTCTEDGVMKKYTDKMNDWEKFQVLSIKKVPSWRGVNLGGFLVLEDWMFPTVMDVRKLRIRKTSPAAKTNKSNGIPEKMRDEWKLAAAVGPFRAKLRLEDHYNKYVQERDFKYLQSHKMNSIRVPIGWWLSEASLSKATFLTSQVRHLDHVFQLARKYKIGVFLSMHASPGVERHRALEGQADWGVFPELVLTMLDTVEWLTKRYARHSQFLGISLLSETIAEGMPEDILLKYFTDGYNIVRKYSPCAYVGVSPRLKQDGSNLKNFMVDGRFTNVLVEIHAYVAFLDPGNTRLSHVFVYIENELRQDIKSIQSYGHTVVVGEWTLATGEGLSPREEDVKRLSRLQKLTFNEANGGWFFWSLKIGRPGFTAWSFIKSTEIGWLKPRSDGLW